MTGLIQSSKYNYMKYRIHFHLLHMQLLVHTRVISEKGVQERSLPFSIITKTGPCKILQIFMADEKL